MTVFSDELKHWMSRPKQYSSSSLPDVVAVDALQARITSYYMNEISCQCMNRNSLEHPKRTEIDELDTYIHSGNVECNHPPFVPVPACQPQIMSHTMSDRSCISFHPGSLGVSNLQKIEVGYQFVGAFGLASHSFGCILSSSSW